MASVAITGQTGSSRTASLTRQARGSGTTSLAITRQAESSETASLAVTGLAEDSHVTTVVKQDRQEDQGWLLWSRQDREGTHRLAPTQDWALELEQALEQTHGLESSVQPTVYIYTQDGSCITGSAGDSSRNSGTPRLGLGTPGLDLLALSSMVDP